MPETPPANATDVLSRHGIQLARDQRERLDRYSSLLRQRNAEVNLTAIVDPAEIETKHFLDSLTLLLARAPAAGARLIDVGTGAGFPGIPLAIARADLHVTLVESVAKKVRFLEEAIAMLALGDVRVAHGRAEQLAHDEAFRERFDVGVVRALPTLALNVELLLPFCRQGGEAVAYKGRIEAELPAARRAAAALGGEISRIVTSTDLSVADALPGRCLVIATKRRPTPARFPRSALDMKRRAW